MRQFLRILTCLVCLIAVSSQQGARAAPADDAKWFVFKAPEADGESVVGMSSWLEHPAGLHGPILMKDEQFVFSDGTRVPKLWGVNLANLDCAPPKALAVKWADFHAKYGVNAVRLHKFIPPGNNGIGDKDDSTKFDPEHLDRFDFFTAELKKRGIYYGFSWVFDHKVRPADRARLRHFDEIVAAGGNTEHVPVFIADDVQDLRIDMLRALLNHTNPYTGVKYAVDPALSYIEFANEDSIFFFTFANFAKQYPLYRAEFTAKFNDHLKDKYKTTEGLSKAWGAKALNAYGFSGESLDASSVQIQPNPWFFSPAGLKQGDALGTRRRLLDTAAFLHQSQSQFYSRFAKSIRDTGYVGPLVGSCWVTPPGVPQYLNLQNDYEVGFIDRHSYFGGQGGWQPKPGPFASGAQVDSPGSGLLSQGFLRTARRPFALSEWTTVFPNEYTSESQVIVAAYGMGLQGWNASYCFASHVNEYKGRSMAWHVDEPRLWTVDLPTQIGLYPVLARMLYRGDIAEGPVISTRRVSLGELLDGKPDWLNVEETRQTGDVKDFQTALPQAALAAGKVVVDFVDKPTASDFPKMKSYVTADGAVRSATNQLSWHPAGEKGRGYIRIDTGATKGFVGFAPPTDIVLSDLTLQMTAGQFAVVLVTPTERDKTFATSKSLLVCAIARARNTGMVYSADGKTLVELGRAPIRLEPVVAKLTFPTRDISAVRPLDHDGKRTAVVKTPADAHTVSIDSGADKTMYFELEAR